MAYKAGDITLYPTGSAETLLSSYGRQVKKSWKEEGRSERTLGGPLKTDITSRKYKFEIPYELIDPTSFNALIALYALSVPLNLKLYDSPSTWFLNFSSAIPQVKMEPIGDTRFINLYSKSVSLVLLEI